MSEWGGGINHQGEAILLTVAPLGPNLHLMFHKGRGAINVEACMFCW